MKIILSILLLLFISEASASTLICNVSDNGQLKFTTSMELNENGDCDLNIGKYDKYDFFAFARNGYVSAIAGSYPSEELNGLTAAIAFLSSTGSYIIVECKI